MNRCPASTGTSRSESSPAPSVPSRAMAQPTLDEPQWDVFISYATEDRQSLVKPLADLLAGMGVRAPGGISSNSRSATA